MNILPSTVRCHCHLWENYVRGRDLRSYYGNTDSIAQSRTGPPNDQMRYMVNQTANQMSGTAMLNFEGDATWKAQQQGRDDAQAALSGNSAFDV